MAIYHSLKLVSAILYQTFIFYQMIALQKLFLFHPKSPFGFWDIQIFVFWPSLIFFLVSLCFRSRSKKNLKVYVVINCPNKNLITHFVWYLEKKIMCDIQTLSIDREIRNIFMNKSYRTWTPKASPRLLFNFAKSPKTAISRKKFF